MRQRSTRGDERGQAATAIIVTVAVLLIAMASLVMVRMAKATDQADGLQRAADAAALAGAQQVAKDAPQALLDALVSGSGLRCGLGQAAASDFAGRNGADLISYCYHPNSDRVEVTIRGRSVTETGRREDRSAVARTGLRLGPCHIPDPPTSSPSSSTPSVDPSAPSTPTTPPPDVQDTASCGDVDIPVTFPGDGGPIQFHLGEVTFHFEPRLRD